MQSNTIKVCVHFIFGPSFNAIALKALLYRAHRGGTEREKRATLKVWEMVMADFEQQRSDAVALLINTPFDPRVFDHRDAEPYEESLHGLGYVPYVLLIYNVV